MTSAPVRLRACGIASGAILVFASTCFAQAPQVIGTYPTNGAARVPVNAVLFFAFDRPTAKHASYSFADITGGGGQVTTSPNRWSPSGDTLYITPFLPLALGHQYGMKLNLLQAADSTYYGNPTYYPEEYYFTTASQAIVQRVQAGNVSLSLTPDVTLPVLIPVRELAGTDAAFTSVRVQFLPSSAVADSGNVPLDLAVSPIYEYTLPISTFLRRFGVASAETDWSRDGFLCSRYPRSVAGRCVVEMVRSTSDVNLAGSSAGRRR